MTENREKELRTERTTSPEHEWLLYGDCLDVMGGWKGESIDFIYLDPPFNSNQDYNMLFGAADGVRAQVRAFTDTWSWTGEAVDRVERLTGALAHPAHSAIFAFEKLLGPSGMLAYLSYMAERLAEMHRLLKPQGSIYLHCDDTAVHYLKILMDIIFGSPNFRNHIVWRRATAHSDARRYGRILDHLLFYSKTSDFFWAGDAVRSLKTGQEIKKAYPSRDNRGRYRTQDLTGPLHGAPLGAPSTLPWKGYDVHSRNRCWSAPKTGAYAEFIEQDFIPGYRQIKGIHDRLDALDKAGLIHHPESGQWPGLKRYARADQGTAPQNLVLNPTGFTNYNRGRSGKEYLQYDTQKPLDLLEPLIRVSCPPKGLVLDPFCGCGTTVLAAHNLGRRWVGIDISPLAVDVMEKRLIGAGAQPRLGGVPYDLEAARRMASNNPFHFETWAITRIPGLIPNESQRRDQGIDGRGRLVSDKNQIVLAQVKVKGTISAVRDFTGVLAREKALGVFITLERPPKSWAAEAARAGKHPLGAELYPRCQLWSIEEFFEGSRPHLPAMLDPFTGKPIQLVTMRLTQ